MSLIDEIHALVENPIHLGISSSRARELADVFIYALGRDFLESPPTARDPITGDQKIRHRLLKMISGSGQNDIALSELLEVGLYLEALAEDSRIQECVDGLKQQYESTLFQLAVAFRLKAAGCHVQLEPDTVRGRSDIGFVFDDRSFVAECYRINKTFADYFTEMQTTFQTELKKLVPEGKTYSYTIRLGRLPTFDMVRQLLRRFEEVVGEIHAGADLVGVRYRFRESTIGVEDITDEPEDPDLRFGDSGEIERIRYEDADTLTVSQLVKGRNYFDALDQGASQRVLGTRVFLWKGYIEPVKKKPHEILLNRLSAKLRQTKPREGDAGRMLFVEFPFGLFLHARDPASLDRIQNAAISKFENVSAVALMERYGGSSNRFQYQGQFLQGKPEFSVPKDLIDRLAEVEKSDLFVRLPEASREEK